MIVNGFHYKVKYNPKIDEKVKDLKGLTDFDFQTITIKPGMNPEAERCTLIHEIVHAMIFSLGLYPNNKFTHEQVCEFIACNFDLLTRLEKEGLKELHGD